MQVPLGGVRCQWSWVQLFEQRSGLGVGADEPSQGAAQMGQGTACPSPGSCLSVASAILCHMVPSCDRAGSRGR